MHTPSLRFATSFLLFATGLYGCESATPAVTDGSSPPGDSSPSDPDASISADVRAEDSDVCEASCGTSECGRDGCGLRCGGCEAGDVCAAGDCVPRSAELCPPAGAFGALPGQTAPNITLYDCDGTPVELHSLCGRRAALVYSFAEWCPGCREVLRDKIVPGHPELREEGDLSTWVVLSEDETRGEVPVDAEACRRIRDQFGVVGDDIQMLYDPTNQMRDVLGMRIFEAALVMKRGARIITNRPSFWSTMAMSIGIAFDETNP